MTTITKTLEVTVEVTEKGYSTAVKSNNFTDYELIGLLETVKEQFISGVINTSSKEIVKTTQE